MSRYHSYLNNAVQILSQYKGEEPFSSFSKKYFSANKKYGSKDRKQISHFCYCYFRLGKALINIPAEEKILIGLFLCSSESSEILDQLKPDWNRKVDLSVAEKLSIINYSLVVDEVFPWKVELSEGINHEKFCESFFMQPDLFLRLRPGYEKIVKKKLLNAAINFEEIDSSCLRLPNNSKIENIIELDREAVVQDLNSQKTCELFKSVSTDLKSKIAAWDCCAGSGGKSILLYDIYPNINLTVSDIRESILLNLKKRFSKAGIKKYKSFVADLSKPTSNLKTQFFDLILCDAPCTGSGTWSRTPEQLYYFNEQTTGQYNSRQKRIVSNIIPYLSAGGYLLYITCSVFKKENENVVDYIREEFNLELIKVELLKGYNKKADTMFVALLRKSL